MRDMHFQSSAFRALYSPIFGSKPGKLWVRVGYLSEPLVGHPFDVPKFYGMWGVYESLFYHFHVVSLK